ncbi:MAG: RhuM family protein, partial [Patescibacteria group bacterium]
MENESQVILYQTGDGKTRVEVRFEHENVWLTQKLMAELFETTVANINIHLKNIFQTGELRQKSVIKEFLITATDGKKYKTKMYGLEVIIAVGYRVNSARGILSRQ